MVGNLGHRVFTFVERYFDGKVPVGGRDGELAQQLLPEIAEHRDRWRKALAGYRFREGLSIVVELARVGNRAFDAAEPWKSRKSDLEKCGRDLSALLELVRAVAGLLTPFLPETAGRIWGAFGSDSQTPTPREVAELGHATLTEGLQLTPPGIVYPRLELADDE